MLSPRAGRMLSAIGAIVLGGALFLTWYHLDRPAAAGEPTASGWEMFYRLRVVILVGAALVLVSALVPQSRPVLIGRTLLGLLLAALIVRRIIDPPQLDYAVTTATGVYIGALGALLAAVGGLVDSGREVIGRRPDIATWQRAAGELPRGPSGDEGGQPPPPPARTSGGEVVDSTGREI